MPQLKRTPFYEAHIKAGAKMVEYAGWEMPLLYNPPGAPAGTGGIIPEHEHTRSSASLFDVSHMGRLKFTGKNAEAFLQKICTRNVSKGVPGQSMYSLVCNETGGILDDVIVSRFDKHWFMVCNASNREKLLGWFNSHIAAMGNVTMEDETENSGMVAIQGPKAVGMLDEVLPEPVSDIKRYHFQSMSFMLVIGFDVFRSGYTGEDGAEIVCGLRAASMAADKLLKSGTENAILKPAGLGARDTLRLEAAMPLYGHELNEHVDPLTAGLAWAVDLTKDFIGGERLRKIQADGLKQKLVGLFIDSPRSARQDMAVLHNGKPIGVVTSGAMSPTLKRCIAMAYIPAELASAATPPALTIDCRGSQLPASITPLPFYKRAKTK